METTICTLVLISIPALMLWAIWDQRVERLTEEEAFKGWLRGQVISEAQWREVTG